MDPSPSIVDQGDEFAAKNRFESFKLGKGLPSNMAQKHTHARSHSRNASISSSVSSMSFSISSKSMNAVDVSTLSLPPHNTNPVPPSKRNSHHRRRSSVSTRHESAEMMGVSVPDLPPSTSEDNINFGEKDSIRRRALWALEGKTDVSYSRVEIPELSTPVMEKIMFDFSSKPSVPQGTVPGFGTGLNTLLSNKRDSFKLLASSSSSKDPLHTLVEEEEEEEDDVIQKEAIVLNTGTPVLAQPVTPSVAVIKATPSRPRPANLSLRPLSLTPENLVNAVSGLPTPSLTPSPRIGLKSLALTPSSSIIDDSTKSTNVMTTRQSITPSPASRRLSLNLSIAAHETSSPEDDKPSRRSSISYKSSSSSSSNGVATNYAGLPTPEMTPTSFDRRYSISGSRRSSASSGEEDFFPNHPTQARPLSASEQHFLFKSHNALLARITDLERALSSGRSSGGYSNNGSSRPVSVASDISSSSDYGAIGEPSDEMLRLVTDLKAERDELKRDVDGWRTRVGDMEKQLTIVTGRVEAERRDAWVARSMSGMLEVEKSHLQRKCEEIEKTSADLKEEKQALQKENEHAKQRMFTLEEELKQVKLQLDEERKFKDVNTDIMATPTPRTPESRPRVVAYSLKRGLGFSSVDSNSTTDVEDSFETTHKFGFSLNSVAEEDEALSEEDNGLAGYEDEEDSDVSFNSSSSFGSEADFPRSVSHLKTDFPASVTPVLASHSTLPVPAPLPTAAPRPAHASRASLSKTWTFPKGDQIPVSRADVESDVDKFFGCLEDLEGDNSDGSAPVSPSEYTYEKSKGLFSNGFKYGADNDEYSPFFFPGGVGVVVEDNGLDTVTEEEEDDTQTEVDEEEDMFGDVGGIRITFTPPEAEESFASERSPSPVKPTVPTINFFDDMEEEGSAPFNFGRSVASEVFEAPKVETPQVVVSGPASVLITPPSSDPRSVAPRVVSPSSIPRSKASLRSKFMQPDVRTATPPKVFSTRVFPPGGYASNAFVTPPNKRGGVMPSFIPQPVSSPSPIRSTAATSRQKTAPNLTFFPHPQRKPLTLANNANKNQNISYGAPNGSTFKPQISAMHSTMNACSLRRSSDIHAAYPKRSISEMKSVDLSDHFIHHNISTTPIQEYPVSHDRPPHSSPLAASVAPIATSFSSIMTSPLSGRLSFQTLTNFIPIPWSTSISGFTPASSTGNTAHYSQCPASDSLSTIPLLQAMPAVIPHKRGYVSKEKQLEKLRGRFEREGSMKMRTFIDVCCQKCDDETVFL
ncbi:hypothetical protein BDZ94DRAFT_1279379 [Collybia nuda]|uniref:Uncharacterized protein n=1 Tax=Collybia nuda TaxID=64659 RepID=A0A9P5YF61_9AGAR|nr:hypothetical protein BDZ94DRAFT_1279379 [Collybia nuda]